MAGEPRLGRTGPRVSRVGLGLWQFGSPMWGGKALSADVLARGLSIAVEEGINLLDTAEVYGMGSSERMLGEAIRRLNAREDFVIVSKVAGFRSTAGDIVRGVRGIAGRLGSAPDVILHHWPPPVYSRLCSVVRGLEQAVNEGLAGYYGFSNYGEDLLGDALSCTRRLEPVADQILYNLAYRTPEQRLIPLIRQHGMTPIAWSPLAKGALAGFRGEPTRAQASDPVFRTALEDTGLQEALESVARRLGASKASVALAWVAYKGAVPIVGWRRPERVREAASAARLKLGEEDVALLDEASKRYVTFWGSSYSPPGLRRIRLIPGALQRLAIRLWGGI
ncbi:putative oxidoreductase, aldo/keto reductase family [Aeropyrum pernix]|uniref:Putative oxidoreductase, aldo/keto reductase family n=1 Tax=Aeropyrum pernix TaxID=56636 RepID=A0A401HB91_AERPX|nr:aldo/keto reductase [Aeropyrum pernix]GBF09716.1 putative oxidoreductase, aldo/keto reductase family [Aeropyrum pernix]